jgi:hypothetical protein
MLTAGGGSLPTARRCGNGSCTIPTRWEGRNDRWVTEPDADRGLRRAPRGGRRDGQRLPPRRRGLHPEPQPGLRRSRDAGSGGQHPRLAGETEAVGARETGRYFERQRAVPYRFGADREAVAALVWACEAYG